MAEYTDDTGTRCFWVPEKDKKDANSFEAARTLCSAYNATLAVLDTAEKVAHIQEHGALDGTKERYTQENTTNHVSTTT